MNQVVNKIRKAIMNTEFENHTYLVGGYVRDYIMGIKSNDIDIVVNLENGGIRLVNYLYEKNISAKPVIYKNFGTALTIIDNTNIELVMTRKESYRAKSRKPTVKPATLEEDAMRRDFTINAIYQKLSDGKILDITTKGLSDIEDKIIRTVSNSERVFSEDPLRMLRAIKFAVRLNFTIERKTFESIKQNAERLNIISVERIKEEFVSILLSQKPSEGIKLLLQTGLMKYIIPEFYEIIDIPQNRYHSDDVLHHTLKVLDNVSPTTVLRISALLHDIGKGRTFSKDTKGNIHFYRHELIGAKMTENILGRLKFSKSLIKKVYLIILNHLRTKQYGDKAQNVKDKTVRKFILQTKGFRDELLELIDADNKAHATKYRLPHQIKYLKKRIANLENDILKMPINGEDIKKYFNLNEGEKVGKLLKKAKDIWLESPHISKKELLERLRA